MYGGKRLFIEFKVKIVYFLKKKYMNRLIMKIFTKLLFLLYKYTSMCKIVIGKYNYKINFKTIFIKYGFRVNF